MPPSGMAHRKRSAKMKRFILPPLLLLILTSCTTFQHGLGREKEVSEFPPAESVAELVRSLPGVIEVRVLTGDGRTNLEYALGLNKGFQEMIVVIYEDFSFTITFDTRKKEKTLLVWHHENTEQPFRQSLEEMRAKMNAVITALHAQFPSVPEWDAMYEGSTWGPEGK
jgi:hypothetical protein